MIRVTSQLLMLACCARPTYAKGHESRAATNSKSKHPQRPRDSHNISLDACKKLLINLYSASSPRGQSCWRRSWGAAANAGSGNTKRTEHGFSPSARASAPVRLNTWVENATRQSLSGTLVARRGRAALSRGATLRPLSAPSTVAVVDPTSDDLAAATRYHEWCMADALKKRISAQSGSYRQWN
jgi:hypothetical protein